MGIVPLFAGFFPETTHSSIESLNEPKLTLSTPFEKRGMSGVVIHHYGNGVEAITHRIVQTSPSGEAKIVPQAVIQHPALPTIKTSISTEDSVIGGYLYENVLLLAPNAQTYAHITQKYAKNWIHPDLYASFLAQAKEATPTKENLLAFAQAYQVGLVYIVGEKEVKLLDPYSGEIVNKAKKSIETNTTQTPFYMHFKKIDTGWFSGAEKRSYYQLMESL
jgi:hypothetical protein